ncbi:MAG: FAD binding domain-containing protein [Planctomycetaceae bacterium]|nr:FAD binding domain-containing protein [Planctomycetales bacterium]MCB9923315.1 FAD binding domain-containing protein [Planctomycetaceae bacterium]
MKAFEYASPRTEAEVVQLLSAEPGKTEILAGGTDLVGLMKKMIVTPDRVVNIMDVPTLKSIDEMPDGSVSIGAAVTLDDILAHPYLDLYPAIKQAIRGISSMQLQAQGTLGGEVCQRPRCWFYRNGDGLLGEGVASGANEFHAILGNSGRAKFVNSSRIAPALIALDAQLRVLGPDVESEQFVPLAGFFRSPQREGQREHVLAANQFVTHIILPPIEGRTCATYEVRHGEGPDYPLAAAAAALRLDGFGIVHDANVVLGQVAPMPWISQEASSVLRGRKVDAALAEAAGEAAVSRATPLSQNAYKVQLAKVAVKRAILLAAGFETGGF